MTQEINLRELSHGESLFYKAALSNSALSAIAGNIPLNVLQDCFNLLMQKHVFLQCVVSEDDNKYYFTQRAVMQQLIDHVELSNQSEITSYDQAHNFFQQTLNSAINAQKTLIEVTCLRPSASGETYLVWRLSHVISDGICLIDLHREFLSLCDQMLMKGALSNTNSEINKTIPNCIESRLSSRPDDKKVEDITEGYLNVIKQAPHQVLCPEKAVSSDLHFTSDQHFTTDQHIEVITHRLSESQTEAVLAWCKQRRLSFNDVFTAALFLKAKELTRQSSFLLRTAVNLRAKVEPNIDKNQLLTAASSIITSTSIQPGDDLEVLSRKVRVSVNEALTDAPYIENLVANKAILKELATTLAFHMSNVGRLAISNDFEAFSLENFVMAPGTSCGKTLPVNVNTFNKRISISTHALLEIYPHEFVEQLILGAIDLMLNSSLKVAA